LVVGKDFDARRVVVIRLEDALGHRVQLIGISSGFTTASLCHVATVSLVPGCRLVSLRPGLDPATARIARVVSADPSFLEPTRLLAKVVEARVVMRLAQAEVWLGIISQDTGFVRRRSAREEAGKVKTALDAAVRPLNAVRPAWS